MDIVIRTYNFFSALLTNRVLMVPLAAWLLAQLIKMFVVLVKEKRLDLRYMVSSGGMPSSHTALVSALATAVGITSGVNSAAFAIAAITAGVGMYDAAGVRRAAGRQAAVLNRLLREFRERRPRDKDWMEQELRELIGHTPTQVIAGAVLGISVTWLVFALGA